MYGESSWGCVNVKFDGNGLFGEPVTLSSRVFVPRPIPPVPHTGWQPPTHFPDLSAARAIAVDVETYDPELLDHGPGWARKRGHIVGISVCTDDRQFKAYYPIRHEFNPHLNLDPHTVLRWANEQLGRPHQVKVGANLMYDVGWLRQEGVHVKGKLFDVQFAEALLDERAKVALEILAHKYLGEGKESSLLYDWCAKAYDGPVDGAQRANIYRAPPELVGYYAESDVDLPIRLMPLLAARMQAEGLTDLFDLENALIPLLIDMRFRGVRVDLDRAARARDELERIFNDYVVKLFELCGFHVEVNSGPSIARAFDKFGIKYPRTADGKPSFRKNWLKGLTHPIGALINSAREVYKLRSTFIESYILEGHVNGRVHCSFHNMRGDEGGTRSGRFSSSDPNLQNVPSRSEAVVMGEKLAELIRGFFIPDADDRQWRKFDYSQIEYRCFISDAVGLSPHVQAKADEARSMFCANPDTDYHDWTIALIKAGVGIDMPRKPAKTINFGLLFGMGNAKLCDTMQLPREKGDELITAYHAGIPFAKDSLKYYSDLAAQTGVVSTILGRKSRFDLWEPANQDSDSGEDYTALPYEQAVQRWSGRLRRAYTHKGLNRRLQGSAADMMKCAMRYAYESGLFDYIGIPLLTVHDELDFSDPGGVADGFAEMKHIMETVLPLRIPVRADCDVGPDWGHVEEVK